MRFAPSRSLRPITIFSLTVAAVALLASSRPALADALVVPLDHSTRLKVAGAAQSVVVGNPTVADVTVVDSHTLFVSGRGYGVTDVVVLDAAGRTLYSTEVVVGVAHTGRVSVFRGGERTDMACAPNCQVSIRTGGTGSSGSAPAATPTPVAGALTPSPE
jgi:Flp pilus assembly secretin CpaC